MLRDGAIERCSEINRWQLRVHVWKEILGTAKRNWYFCACSPLELTFVYACS